jgi:hypothetical protein
MNSPIDLSEDISSDEIRAEEEEIASVQSKLEEVKSWIDDNLRHERDDRSDNSFTLSIPCLIKKPKQPEVKGVIKQDLGDRFVVYIPVDGSTVTISKLFVYPDFSKSPKGYRSAYVGQIDKCSSKSQTPSTKSSSKTRREKGFGSGHIYYRTVTRNNKEYQQAYYQWRVDGKQKTKYIPNKLLDRVKEAEFRKLRVADILLLLGGDDKCSFQSSITCPDEVKCSSKQTHPSTKRRKQGDGAGYIECKPIKRGNKEYKQYWYHWEIWDSGDRITKKSKYIPRRLLARVEELETQKAPVKEILEVLGMKE